MKITKTYKYKLRLTRNQKNIFSGWLGTCRFLYNSAKETRDYAYSSAKVCINYYSLANELKNIKKTECLEWVKNTPSGTLQDVLERLEKSYQSFFKSGAGFPKYAKKDKYNSFTLKRLKKDTHNRFILPKIGSVKYFNSRTIPEYAKLKRCTIIKKGNDWYISVLVEESIPIFKPASENQAVGLDWGIARFYTLSNGEVEANPRFFQTNKEELKRLQQSLSSKKKGSHNWKNVKRQLNRLHSKIARQRKDWHHNLTTDLVRRYDSIFMEDLRIKNMSKSAKGDSDNHGKNVKQKSGLNREILDTAPYQFSTFLEYKCIWHQREFARVPAKNSSRECSCCGHTSKLNRKSQSKFECESCGHSENADQNAAKNILGRGYMTLSKSRLSSKRA